MARRITALWLLTLCSSLGVAWGADQARDGTHDALEGLRVSGPHVHQNLAVYFLHREQRDDRNFLTLNDGLEKKLVKVTELENEQVTKLMIENLSDDPLFLQEGDRVTGGKQDRTIYSSLVIAPKSGPQEIPAFCVEPSRWAEGDTGKQFKHNPNGGYAANNVRSASKLLKDQGRVWDNVAQAKGRLTDAIGNKDKTSSLNEAQDSKQVAESTAAFMKALGSKADQEKDIVGIAFAVGGKLQEINIYPGRPLAQRVYPRLLETYALDAVVQASEKKDASQAKAPPSDQVMELLKSNVRPKAQREEKINADNGLTIFAAEKANADKTRFYRCATDFKGKTVHLQWIEGPQSLEEATRGGDGNERQQRQGDFDNGRNDLRQQQ